MYALEPIDMATDIRRYWSALLYKTHGFIWCTDRKFIEALFDKLFQHDPSMPLTFIKDYHVAFDPDDWHEWFKITYPNLTFWLNWKHVPAGVRNKIVVRLQTLASKWNT